MQIGQVTLVCINLFYKKTNKTMKILKYILLLGLKGLGHFIYPRRTGR